METVNRRPVLSDWSEEHREKLVKIVMNSGWTRLRPSAMLYILAGSVAEEQPLTREELLRFTWEKDMDAPCWHPDDGDFTEEEIAHQQAQADGWAAPHGVGPVRTVGDVFDLLVACGALIEQAGQDGVVRLYPTDPPPRPRDCFQLPAEEVAMHDWLLLKDEHQQIENAVIEMFEPDGAQHPQLVTSLGRLSRRLNEPVERVRTALKLMLEPYDTDVENAFTCNRPIENVTEHQVFTLACAWERFWENTIGIVSAPTAAD